MKHFKFSRSASFRSMIAVFCIASFTACDNDSVALENAPEPIEEDSTSLNLKPASLNNTAWFTGDVRIDFPEVSEELYLNYLPDGLYTSQWIKLTQKDSGTFDAEIVWSKDIREIGKKFTVTIEIKNDRLSIQSDEFNFKNLSSYEGVTASLFDPSKIAALETDYLSNFDGSYKLDSSNFELNIGAKINLSKDVNHYWNANVLNTVYDEENSSYDFLLAHSSQKDASGSIDPGITGLEPFISNQGLFWSHMTLTAKPGSVWKITWSSYWKDSPYEALNTAPDQSDTFLGPATSKIKYTYKFYFGNPTKDENGWYSVQKADFIDSIEFETDLPVNKTWKEIYEENQIESKINIPEDKLFDYWWYSTNAITSIEDSFVYKLTDSYKPSLENYEFYLALKEKPAETAIYTNPGIFYYESKGRLTISKTSITWEAAKKDEEENWLLSEPLVYEIIGGAQWSEAGKSTTTPKLPLQYCYLVSDGEKNYYCLVEYYVNNGFNYNHFRTPKETSDTVCTQESNFTLFTSYVKNLYLPQE